jgi:hypothetical protein
LVVAEKNLAAEKEVVDEERLERMEELEVLVKEEQRLWRGRRGRRVAGLIVTEA